MSGGFGNPYFTPRKDVMVRGKKAHYASRLYYADETKRQSEYRAFVKREMKAKNLKGSNKKAVQDAMKEVAASWRAQHGLANPATWKSLRQYGQKRKKTNYARPQGFKLAKTKLPGRKKKKSEKKSKKVIDHHFCPITV